MGKYSLPGAVTENVHGREHVHATLRSNHDQSDKIGAAG